jgi:hypothetical protein
VKVVRQGTQVGGRSRSVQIVGLDYDFWHEDRRTRGILREDERPLPLGDDGMLYYVVFREVGDESLFRSVRVDTEGFATLEDAAAEAESLIVNQRAPRVVWDK